MYLNEFDIKPWSVALIRNFHQATLLLRARDDIRPRGARGTRDGRDQRGTRTTPASGPCRKSLGGRGRSHMTSSLRSGQE